MGACDESVSCCAVLSRFLFCAFVSGLNRACTFHERPSSSAFRRGGVEQGKRLGLCFAVVFRGCKVFLGPSTPRTDRLDTQELLRFSI